MQSPAERKETVDINILITSRNGDKKILQPIEWTCYENEEVEQIQPVQMNAGNLASINMFKVNNRNTRSICEIYPKTTREIPKQRHWRRSGVLINKFEYHMFSGISIVDFEQVDAKSTACSK